MNKQTNNKKNNKKNNKTLTSILIIIMTFFIISVMAGLFSDSETSNYVDKKIKQNTKQETKNDISNELKKDLPNKQAGINEIRETYIKGCVDEGANRSYCACTYDYLLNDLGEEKFTEEVIDLYIYGEFSDLLLNSSSNAVVECIDKLK